MCFASCRIFTGKIRKSTDNLVQKQNTVKNEFKRSNLFVLDTIVTSYIEIERSEL